VTGFQICICFSVWVVLFMSHHLHKCTHTHTETVCVTVLLAGLSDILIHMWFICDVIFRFFKNYVSLDYSYEPALYVVFIWISLAWWRICWSKVEIAAQHINDVINVRSWYYADCCRCGFVQLEIVKLLVESGANVNHRDHVGVTALFWATGGILSSVHSSTSLC